MPFGYKNEGGVITVSRISYICQSCSFTTTSKEEEAEHYLTGHFLSSSMGEPVPYDRKLHGDLPGWMK